jgi:hypothetical protein
MVARRKRDDEQLLFCRGTRGLSTARVDHAIDDNHQILCRYCSGHIGPIEALVDGERWWRCPHCAALLDKIEGRPR